MPPVLVLLSLFGAAPPPASAPLTAVLAVRRLAPPDAAGRPVRLVGVITHWNRALNDGFLQDDTGGIYLTPTLPRRNFRPGDRVEVRGVADPGDFAPCVRPHAFLPRGRAPLPDAEPFNLDPDDAGPLDGQFVHVHAYAHRVTADASVTALHVVSAAGRGLLLVPGGHRAAFARFVGKSVQVRAVCVPAFDASRRATGGPTRLWVSDPDAVREMAAEPPAAPAPLATYLRGYQPGPNPSARPVRLVGTLTGRVGQRDLFLQDETGGALVSSAETLDPRLEVGDRIEARGFLDTKWSMLLVRNAIVKRVGPGRVPAPLPAGLPLFRPEVLGRLATLEADVESGQLRENGYVLNLRDGPNRFQATLLMHPDAERLSTFEPGSRVRLVGVPFVYFRGEREEGPPPPALVLRSPGDVELIAPPPRPAWWTSARVGWLVSVFACALAVIILWAWSLRLQVARQTAIIQETYEREAKLAESLRHARQLEALGRLTAGISHDFNNLLTVIMGSSEMLADSPTQSPEDRDLALMIVQAGARAAGLTRQLLQFSRPQPVALRPLDLGAFLGENEGILRRLVGEHIHLRVEAEAGLPAVMAERTLVHQILMNLTANARDAMPSGGALTLWAGRAGAGVRLTVRDTGVGMDEATQARVFEPFFTTKEVGKGTGLGLATVYGTAKVLRASVAIESAPGRGTAIHLDFPPAGESAEAPAAAGPPRPGDGAVVLLLDDDDGVREICKQALEMYGFRVLPAARAVEALDLAAKPGRIDLLVTDLILPGMNGKEAALAIRAARPGLRVLFMSGYPAEEVARVVGALPGFATINKPFTPLSLVAAVQEALAGEKKEVTRDS